MNYEDEDYVRFFTRDTVSWLALGWEGQCVLALMLHGKFDRSGVFDCDGHDPSHAVTMVTRIPEEIVKVGLDRLFGSKTWVHRDGKIVWPKYVEAQNCKRSDRARQAESREKRRLMALGTGVTQDAVSVTGSHDASQAVTKCHPSLAKPNLADGWVPPPPPLESVETPVPLDLAERCDEAGIPEQFAKTYRVPIEAVRAHIDEIVAYWSIGPGAGRRKKQWLRVVRGRLHELGKAGKLDEIARHRTGVDDTGGYGNAGDYQ